MPTKPRKKRTAKKRKPSKLLEDALARASFALTRDVKALASWVDEVLSALGIAEAFVSDESMVGDFLSTGSHAAAKLARLGKRVGSRVRPTDRIAEIARRLRKRTLGRAPLRPYSPADVERRASKLATAILADALREGVGPEDAMAMIADLGSAGGYELAVDLHVAHGSTPAVARRHVRRDLSDAAAARAIPLVGALAYVHDLIRQLEDGELRAFLRKRLDPGTGRVVVVSNSGWSIGTVRLPRARSARAATKETAKPKRVRSGRAPQPKKKTRAPRLARRTA